MTQIPETMTAIRLNSFGVEGLAVEQVAVPKPKPSEVLIRMAASPINPSDMGFIYGTSDYNRASLPAIPGIEGSGTVIQAPSGMMGNYLMDKRVACTKTNAASGTWAEYMVTSASTVFPLNDDVSMEQGAMSVINPLTALALIDIVKKGKHRSIVSTAAASTLGQMLNRLAAKEGIQLINIVRRQDQVELLKKQGASIILNSADDDFKQQLRDVCKKHEVRLALDAILGSMTDTLLGALMSDGTVIVYGALSGEKASINFNHFIGPDKTITGFLLSTWIGKRNFLQNMLLWRKTQGLMNSDLQSEIRTKVSLLELPQAVKDYQTSMSGGKILLVTDN